MSSYNNKPIDGPWLCFVSRPEGHTVYDVMTHTHTGIAVSLDYWSHIPGHKPPTDDVYGTYTQPDDHADISPHRIATARLIAASPDLLAACKAATEAVDKALRDEIDMDCLAAIMKRVQAAIAKAEGGKP